MVEEAKRLAPTSETLRRLFLTSGNLCAYPGCAHLLMNEAGVFIAQLCHIEAAEKGGQRFNRLMSNEQRRAFENLLMLCHAHHKITDDVDEYPVERLKQIKADHEKRFSNPQRAILEKLTDWTELDTPTQALNLRKLNDVLGWSMQDEHLREELEELNQYVERFRTVPIELRRFLGAVARRSWKMKDSGVVRTRNVGGTLILASDIEAALRIDRSTVAKKVNALESYSLMSVDEIDTSSGVESALRIHDLPSGWNLWPDLIDFCDKAKVDLEVFTEELDFARLDG